MKITQTFLFGMSLGMAVLLRADPPQSPERLRHERAMEKMDAGRRENDEHSREAQEQYQISTTEMSDHTEQQRQDVAKLKSVDHQVSAGKIQKRRAHAVYKDSVQKYGVADPRSATAHESWKESERAMTPLLESRRSLRLDIREGGRLLHNERTLLSIQKMGMDSSARYRAIDDRKYEKEEKRYRD